MGWDWGWGWRREGGREGGREGRGKGRKSAKRSFSQMSSKLTAALLLGSKLWDQFIESSLSWSDSWFPFFHFFLLFTFFHPLFLQHSHSIYEDAFPTTMKKSSSSCDLNTNSKPEIQCFWTNLEEGWWGGRKEETADEIAWSSREKQNLTSHSIWSSFTSHCKNGSYSTFKKKE